MWKIGLVLVYPIQVAIGFNLIWVKRWLGLIQTCSIRVDLGSTQVRPDPGLEVGSGFGFGAPNTSGNWVQFHLSWEMARVQVFLATLGTSPSKLNVVHQHGPCSSLTHQYKPSHVDIFRQDQARVEYIQHQAANATTGLNVIGGSLSARVPAKIDYSLGVFDYIVSIGLGTPTKFFTVIFDTGSDLTWTQCLPCINCYNQKDPIFDPTQSSTFTTIECTSNYCIQLPRFGCSSTFTCLYEQRYTDSTISKGSLIQDTLKFSDDNIQNIHFGCGDNNTGYFGHVDGILGLGRGALSIISQTTQLYNNIFSYCLPSGPNKVGYLELGSAALGVKYTPMLTNPKMPSYYFINLTAISVGGERLPLSPTIFSGPGTLLDSGTSFTHLPPTVYSALRNIFREKMTDYPMAPPLFDLDTCYDLTNFEQVVVPQILLIYDGEVTTNLDTSGILLLGKKSQTCLAFVENKDDSELVVIGNLQQRRFDVVYDVGNLQIGFGINGCS
ncbi:Protein ASPARTIC PROTEASE IN GUARD CELL 2 [Dendrobium catenatum]|uniref:Protein ASPARTIC PROTEASE IN GUARD CELL 2 n=1 Tax=Dendrobium catenatum TaxID=906689 RepID=A0A2I0WUP8_9ASPA|nr:Protein ASPARTIC PROTEASE IN GUARD CELL 2 [Dendrobium catenatum]